jgi:hypothetical protein
MQNFQAKGMQKNLSKKDSKAPNFVWQGAILFFSLLQMIWSYDQCSKCF